MRAGAYPNVQTNIVTPWHSHEMHQIAYADEGLVQVETAAARYLLPPQQAAWIPAGLAHQTTLVKVKEVSLFFDPLLIVGATDRVRVLRVTPVFRELILYATRWPIAREPGDALADVYFATVAGLVSQWLDEDELPFHVPTAKDPLVASAMRYTDAHLADVHFADVCRHVALSERSLRRRFLTDAGLSWRDYLLRSRLMTSMTLLSETRHTVAIVASRVGFASASAFARAFCAHTGESPSEYRRRV